MKLFIYLTGILTLARLSTIDTFVVTRYSSSIIVKYYKLISEHFTPTGDIDRFFQHYGLVEFCRQLRESIFFDMTNNTNETDVNDSDSQFSNTYITSDDLQIESEQARIIPERHGLLDDDYRVFPTFRCLNPRGALARAIAPGFVPNTAFMSTYISPTRYTMSALCRNMNRNRLKLIAIIDAPAVILTEAPNFNDFIEARSGLQRDPLCGIKKLLKFRLCAAASIALGRVDRQYHERKQYNKYYQPDDDEESCRYLEGIDWTSGRYPKMLLCSVKLKNTKVFKSFYLSLDVLVSNNVLVMRRVWNGSQYVYDTQYLYVPLLDHLQQYEEAFKNTDI